MEWHKSVIFKHAFIFFLKERGIFLRFWSRCSSYEWNHPRDHDRHSAAAAHSRGDDYRNDDPRHDHPTIEPLLLVPPEPLGKVPIWWKTLEKMKLWKPPLLLYIHAMNDELQTYPSAIRKLYKCQIDELTTESRYSESVWYCTCRNNTHGCTRRHVCVLMFNEVKY